MYVTKHVQVYIIDGYMYTFMYICIYIYMYMHMCIFIIA